MAIVVSLSKKNKKQKNYYRETKGQKIFSILFKRHLSRFDMVSSLTRTQICLEWEVMEGVMMI